MIKSLVLMGYMGCGKSALGKRLAQVKSLTFIDLDDYIQSNEKTTISQFFENQGELKFRQIERFYLEKLLSEYSQAIISLGGGTPCYFDNIDFVNQKEEIVSFYLKTAPDTLAQRLFDQKDHRPMIAHLDSKQELVKFIAKHLFERIPFYNKAQHHISTDHQSIDNLVNEIDEILT